MTMIMLENGKQTQRKIRPDVPCECSCNKTRM